jgi:redox-sensitive bicupin YhaK (pirin superfamily)
MHTTPTKTGVGAHPHRGIATLSYIISGEDEHFDSAGNYAKVHSGGVQWMKAGSGVLHDETLNYDSKTADKLIHAFQFWVNLPAAIKKEKPAYVAIEGTEVPRKNLASQSGWLKVIVGSYEGLESIIPTYSEQFLFHIHLEPKKSFSITMAAETEVAAFLPTLKATINDEEFNAGDFIEFDRSAGRIEIKNGEPEACDILLFGGEPYTEPIVAEGPFVMNSKSEIAIAYRSFYNGDYGTIDYDKQRAGQ